MMIMLKGKKNVPADSLRIKYQKESLYIILAQN